jgi:hypothetical protein
VTDAEERMVKALAAMTRASEAMAKANRQIAVTAARLSAAVK